MWQAVLISKTKMGENRINYDDNVFRSSEIHAK